MTGCGESRRAFLKAPVALAGAASLMEGLLPPEPGGDTEPPLAYVGTFCYPRSCYSDPTGRFLYCRNKRGDSVAVFRVDHESGGLAFTGHYVPSATRRASPSSVGREGTDGVAVRLARSSP